MRIIYVDDEEYMDARFEMECEAISGIQLLGCFKNPIEALRFARDNYIEAAFLDVRMPEMTGLELSERLRELYPKIVIVFISAHDEYMREALKEKGADYYILKPYFTTDITAVMERAKLLMKRQMKSITIETFGRFSVYVDGRYVKFRSKKAKEIMAILVDNRGTSVDAKTIWNTMYDVEYNHSNASKIRRALLKLREILREEQIESILVYDDGEYSLNTDAVECDLYNFLNGDAKAMNEYYGEYMSDYSWAETTNGMLMGMCPPDHRCFKRN